jgi:hypothetical protein
MYIRFVIHQNDPRSGRRQGLFQALDDLVHRQKLELHETELWQEVYNWFKSNLEKPRSFARATKPHAKKVALSWFKVSALDHIAKMRILSHILESHGVAVAVLQTSRPGYVVYEDQYQVAAEPFRETIT